MDGSSLTGHVAANYIHIPSTQMVIRRYRPLKANRIRSFFTKGVYCHHLPEYNDDPNEGLLQNSTTSQNFRAVTLAQAQMVRNRRDLPELEVSEEEFDEMLVQYHEDTRHKHFANCWRLGTDETKRIWKDYTGDDNMIEGIAFETTVGQFAEALPLERGDRPETTPNVDPYNLEETSVENMYAAASNSDLSIGAVWYQPRDHPTFGQPGGQQATVCFFKDEEYDDEREFRLVINPFDNAAMMRINIDGELISYRPNVEEDHRFFPMNTTEMIDKIILAPYAGGLQRSKLESILDSIGVSYGSGESDDVKIVNSQITGSDIHYTHDYAAEFGGTDNYERTADYLNQIREDFIENGDLDVWPVLDLVELSAENWGTVIENYRHSSESPPIETDEYGIEGYQAIYVDRLYASGRTEEYQNERGEELAEKNRKMRVEMGFEWLNDTADFENSS